MAIIKSTVKVDINKIVPDQTANNGKVLGTNGSTVSWVTALTAQNIVTHNLNVLGGELIDYDLATKSYVSAGYRVLTDINGEVVTI